MYVIGLLEPDLKGFDGTDKEVHDRFEYLVEKFEELLKKRQKQSIKSELIHNKITEIDELTTQLNPVAERLPKLKQEKLDLETGKRNAPLCKGQGRYFEQARILFTTLSTGGT